ncbi:MAG: hypothetical protein DRN71_04830 [Candidatus Nanohalarchaeota archaeon]|nr:MAG: hypothetical protein DRN71_04830 [Candidatus Nanohaloarchaeota archaeon]
MNPAINHIKSLILLCATLILLANPAHAESGIDLFEETSIAPPSLEDAEIYTDTIKLILDLKDINTKQPVTDIHMNIELISVTSATKTIKYLGDNAALELNLPREDWIIILKGDILNTTGKDYYAAYTIELNADINKTIYLLPVGSVEGMVYTDKKQTQVVEGAILKFDCNADYGDPKDMTTDTFGSFKSEWLPATTCRIYAKHENQVGSTEVTISPGTLSNTQIILDKDTAVKDHKIQLLLAAVGLILLVMFLIRLRKYSSKTPKKEHDQAPQLPKRTKDIINTLNQKEKSIVTFLLENNNESTQNKIYHSTFIPKTSLTRSLLLLEQKRIIQIEKLGNLRKIKLTEWFLDKD